MLNRIQITCLLALTVATWAISLLVMGIPFTWDHAKPFGVTVTVLATAMIIFDRWAWKFGICKGWLVRRPYLQGTWRGVLQSSYVDPKTGSQIPPIDCVVVIRQTFAGLSLRLFTKESSSFLITQSLTCKDDGIFELAAMYRNTPGIELRGVRSEIHYGALLLEVRGDPPTELNGHYWTDRATKGSLILSDRRTKLVGGFVEGASLFGF